MIELGTLRSEGRDLTNCSNQALPFSSWNEVEWGKMNRPNEGLLIALVLSEWLKMTIIMTGSCLQYCLLSDLLSCDELNKGNKNF